MKMAIFKKVLKIETYILYISTSETILLLKHGKINLFKKSSSLYGIPEVIMYHYE